MKKSSIPGNISLSVALGDGTVAPCHLDLELLLAPPAEKAVVFHEEHEVAVRRYVEGYVTVRPVQKAPALSCYAQKGDPLPGMVSQTACRLTNCPGGSCFQPSLFPDDLQLENPVLVSAFSGALSLADIVAARSLPWRGKSELAAFLLNRPAGSPLGASR